jgi:hypothetical protein
MGTAGSAVKEIQAWLLRCAERDERIPSVDDVFLSGRFGAYAWYRLRFFFLRWLSASAVHICRVVLLSAAFSRRNFVQLLLAETAVGFLSSFWWGALEPMRERVRELRRQGRLFAVPQEIDVWLAASLVLAALVMAACSVWLLASPRAFGPFELYGVALAVRLALQFVTRTFHSGIYAMRRVYRPAWSIVAVEVVAFATIAAVWPVFGAWALPLGTLVSAIAGSGITLYFTHRMYQFIGMRPRWAALLRVTRRKISWTQVLAAGLSFGIMKLDAVLVFGLFDYARRSAGVPLFVLLFVMAPTIQAGFDWAYLFYFDLKRLHAPTLAPLLEQYRARITRLALVMGLAFWALGSLTGTVVFLRSLGTTYWLLCPFFVVRSLVASAQIQAFSVRRYGVLLGTSSLWLLGFELARRLHGDAARLGAITLVSALVYLVLAVMSDAKAWTEQREAGIVEWLRLLAAIPTAVQIRSATLRPLRPRRGQPRAALRGIAWSQRQFARAVALRLGRSGGATLVPPDRVVWFESVSGRRIRPATIAALSGGVAQSVRSSGVHPNGRAAAAAAWREHGFEAAFGPLRLDDGPIPALADLQAEFSRLFPDGWTFAPGATTDASKLPAKWRRRIIRSATRFLEDLGPPRDASPFDISAFSAGGRLQVVFVTEADRRAGRRHIWQTKIRRANIAAALNDAR